ncbi:hypothetical protein M6D93_14665 [Jatrophihabitans telluris]|uniref:Bifunctional glucose-6-phosphate/mannose-6-phosphate isomerase C-terminal domain-containing protein n=1 Tax=Jatrophihabitans telluris TaxID=2038343 RepID=A0ABY4QVL1_9ACTN|nr:SIS domain-containing protein [Jatrophihabitans telluris]UQX87535.1 hypothetical protein M6D93_14665 [Jatrophihabitans telluris]
MPAFDPEVLENPETLQQIDRSALLRALAGAGAHVRRALATVAEMELQRLAGFTPRALLVATDAHVPYLSNLLTVLAGDQVPVVDWREPALPRWAGPADALVVCSADGRHPRLAELTEQADRRGLSVAAVAPAGTPVSVSAARHPLADIGYLTDSPRRALWWALATPVLLALEAMNLTSVSGELIEVADALDAVAEANRPDSSAFTGPAKMLATDLAEAVPVVAGAGRGATVAARRVAGAIQLIGGSTAMAASLPDDVARVGSLLEFASAESDFFADRVTDTRALPRLVLIGDDEPFAAELSPTRDPLSGEAARRAGRALAELATSRGIGCSRIDVPDADALVRFAAAAAVGDFAASYLALGRGIDPAAPRLGELPH